jgi:hypothetical protein
MKNNYLVNIATDNYFLDKISRHSSLNLSRRKENDTIHKHPHISKGKIQQKRNIEKMHKLQVEHQIIPTATKIQ